MEDNDHISQIKTASSDMSRFRVAEKEKGEEEQFEHWINKTSKLIKKPYFITFKMVEKWPLEKIISRYQEATKHSGNMPEDIYWWWKRKQDKL